jgi:hypothetical protein
MCEEGDDQLLLSTSNASLADRMDAASMVVEAVMEITTRDALENEARAKESYSHTGDHSKQSFEELMHNNSAGVEVVRDMRHVSRATWQRIFHPARCTAVQRWDPADEKCVERLLRAEAGTEDAGTHR